MAAAPAPNSVYQSLARTGRLGLPVAAACPRLGFPVLGSDPALCVLIWLCLCARGVFNERVLEKRIGKETRKGDSESRLGKQTR